GRMQREVVAIERDGAGSGGHRGDVVLYRMDVGGVAAKERIRINAVLRRREQAKRGTYCIVEDDARLQQIRRLIDRGSADKQVRRAVCQRGRREGVRHYSHLPKDLLAAPG